MKKFRDFENDDAFAKNKFESYIDLYQLYLSAFADKNINILEIGVKEGKSLNLWKKFFENAEIYGVDINPKCKQYEDERIHITIGHQDEPSTFKAFPNFDIVIDDGSHISNHIVKSFEILWDKINPGGFYFIEDTSMIFHDYFLGQKQDRTLWETFINHNIRKLDLDGFSHNFVEKTIKENPKTRFSFEHAISKKIPEMVNKDNKLFVNDLLYFHAYSNIVVLKKKMNTSITAFEEQRLLALNGSLI